MKLAQILHGSKHVMAANLLRNYKLPLNVYLAVTERCPNNCKYCNYKDYSENHQNELTDEQILCLIDEMHALGTQRLQITGGEPMFRRGIGKIIDHAKDRGMFIGLSTSGYQISERVAELKNADIVFLSLDGEEEINDYLRGPGIYRTVMEAMSALRENNINFWTTTVVTKKNMHSIDFILKLAKEKGFLANFILLYHQDYGTNQLPPGFKVRDLTLTDKEIREVLAYLLKKKKQGEPVGSSTSYFNFLLNWKDYTRMFIPERHEEVKCWAGVLSCHIDSKGILYACGGVIGLTEGMDTKTMGLKRAFESAKPMKGCNTCIYACWLESNLLFSLNASSIWNWLHALRG